MVFPTTRTSGKTDDSSRYKLEVEEAGRNFYIVDKDGLITKVFTSHELMLLKCFQ
jgi:hypothetical protein